MINRFPDYDTTPVYGEGRKLPKGGYILTIRGTKVDYSQNGNQFVKLMCDIREGEYKDFFTKQYTENTKAEKKWGCNYILFVPTNDGSEQDGWTKRRFKTVITSIEHSNEGYKFDWNENSLKGKVIGGLFNMREYLDQNGSKRSGTNLAQLISVSHILDNDYTLPEDKLLEEKPAANAYTSVGEGFITSVDDEGLPFN